MATLITWSLRHPTAVIACWAIIATAGVLSFAHLPLDAFPDTTPVQVQVNVAAAALGPLEVERQLTSPLERALFGLPGLHEVRSVSKPGYAQITAVFHDDTDLAVARQQVLQRLTAVSLPDSVEPPTLGPSASGLGEVFQYVIEGASLAELHQLQRFTIAPALRAIAGVAEVNTWGGDERQVHIVIHPTQLLSRGLGIDDVVTALQRNNGNAGGGTIERGGEAAWVQAVGVVRQQEDIAAIAMARSRDDVPMRIGDIAEVVAGRAPRRGATTLGGQGEVVLGLGFVAIGAPVQGVTQAMHSELIEVQKRLPQGVTATVVYARTTLIDEVLRTVRTNLLEGALLVMAVLLLFLGQLRAGVVVAMAIPLSMLFAIHVMFAAGIAGSLMSLGAIDFGLVVDSSVVQVENMVRRLHGDDGRRSREELIAEAALEVRRPTLFGEMIIMVVYLPVLTLTGIEGKLFRPMAFTVVAALLGSMLLSMTLMPVLGQRWLRPTQLKPTATWMAWLQRGYRRILHAALGHPRAVLSAAAVVMMVGMAVATTLGTEFIPRMSEGSIVINTVRLASVSLDESVRIGNQLEQALLSSFGDEIDAIWSRTGTAEVATDPMGVELTDVFIRLRPRDQWTHAHTEAELTEAMQRLVRNFPGMRATFTQPIEMRMNEMIAGIRSDVGVRIFGDDIEVLKTQALRVESVLKRVAGATDVTVEQITGAPMIIVELDRYALAQHGMTVADATTVVQALGGIEVGGLVEGMQRVPMVLRWSAEVRTDISALGDVPVRAAASGDQVPLRTIASLRTIEGPSAIHHHGGQRRILVQTNVRGRDVGGFVAEAQAAIEAQVSLSPGHATFGGQFEHWHTAVQRLVIVVPSSLLLIFVLLMITYGRLRDAARVFIGVPFGAVGGVMALWLRDLPLSVSAVVGFIALAGISVLADMVLVSTIRRSLDNGATPTDAVMDAANERLRPVLITAAVAALGFIPMALSTGIGAEVQRPLATVVIGGVLSSTWLTLLVLPVLYAASTARAKP